jgi:hypothetical protein
LYFLVNLLKRTFANSGGIHQGGKYDGVPWLYLNGDQRLPVEPAGEGRLSA